MCSVCAQYGIRAEGVTDSAYYACGWCGVFLSWGRVVWLNAALDLGEIFARQVRWEFQTAYRLLFAVYQSCFDLWSSTIRQDGTRMVSCRGRWDDVPFFTFGRFYCPWNRRGRPVCFMRNFDQVVIDEVYRVCDLILAFKAAVDADL